MGVKLLKAENVDIWFHTRYFHKNLDHHIMRKVRTHIYVDLPVFAGLHLAATLGLKKEVEKELKKNPADVNLQSVCDVVLLHLFLVIRIWCLPCAAVSVFELGLLVVRSLFGYYIESVGDLQMSCLLLAYIYSNLFFYSFYIANFATE